MSPGSLNMYYEIPPVAPTDSVPTPIIVPREDGPQSPTPSSASSEVSTLNRPTYKGWDKWGLIPTVTFMLSGNSTVLPLPETYEEAVQALIDFYTNHGHENGALHRRLDPSQIVLKIYAGTAIEPLLWSQLVLPGALVQVQILDNDGQYFMHGQVYLCLGYQAENDSKTVWTVPDANDIIDRPFSYKHAVELVKRRIQKGGKNVRQWKGKDLTHASFTFYITDSFRDEFPVDPQPGVPEKKPSGIIATMKRVFKREAVESLDARTWRKIRPDVYDDDGEIWRRWVPFPGKCLGVIIEEVNKEGKL